MTTEISHQELVNRVEAALESIRPFLKKDGGDVELVDIIEWTDGGITTIANGQPRCPTSHLYKTRNNQQRRTRRARPPT